MWITACGSTTCRCDSNQVESSTSVCASKNSDISAENLVVFAAKQMEAVIEFEDIEAIRLLLDSLKQLSNVRDSALWIKQGGVLEKSPQDWPTALSLIEYDRYTLDEQCAKNPVELYRRNTRDSTVYSLPICLKATSQRILRGIIVVEFLHSR